MAQTHSLDLERSSSQFAYRADDADLDFAGSLTFMAWVKLEQLPSTAGGDFRIITKSDGNTDRAYSWHINNNVSDGLELELSGNGGTSVRRIGNSAANFFTSADVGVWIHLAATYNDSTNTIKFYRNGLETATSTRNDAGTWTSIHNSAADFRIGAVGNGAGGTASYFDGLIKDVRVFGSVLTQAQIVAAAHTENYTAVTPAGEWNLNNDYTDSSGNSNTLTASGSPVFSSDIPWEGASAISGSTYLETSLSAYFAADDDLVDSTSNGNDLTHSGSAVYAAGVLGNGLDLESSNPDYAYILYANQVGLAFAGSFGFSIWIKPESNAVRYLLERRDGSTSNQNYFFWYSGTELSVGFRDTSGTVRQCYYSSASFSTGTLYHVVGVFNADKDVLELYINGVLVQVQTGITQLPQSTGTQNLRIGAENPVTTTTFDGVMDEIALYGRALHYGDVLDLYNAGSGIPYEASSVSTGSNDTVTVTEDVTNRVTSLIGVSDAVTVTEGVELGITSFVDVSDVITVDEGVELVIASFVDVSDAITVDESVDQKHMAYNVGTPVIFGSISGTTTHDESVTVVNNGSLVLFLMSSATSGDNHGTPTLGGVNMTQVGTGISGNQRKGTLWYAENVAAGSPTLHCAPSSIGNRYSGGFVVIEGVKTSGALDTTNQAGTETGTSRTGSVTPSVANALTIMINFNLYNAGTNSTKAFGTNDDHNLFYNTDDKAASSFSMTATYTSSHENAYIIAAFLPISITSIISVSDSVAVAESVANVITSSVAIDDNVTVTEGVELGITSFVDVSDVITVDEGVELVIASFVDVSDAITVDESVDLQQANGISASDVVTVTESVEVFITELFLSVSDDVVIDESVSVSFDVSISVTDSVTVAENVEQILTSFTDVSDDITVDESAEMFITELHLSVSDDVAIDEALDFMFETYLMVYEEITVDEDVTVTLSPDIYDEITVEEDVSIAILVTLDVYDEVAVSESTERLILSFVSVSDDVTLTEGDFDFDSVIFGPQIPGKRPRGNAYFNNQQVSYGGSVG